MKNEYIPHPAIIESIREESLDTRTYRLVFEEKEGAESFSYRPGQFVEVSLLGIGEAPISITSSPHRKGFLEITVRTAGKLTRAINRLETGDKLFLRGPYGNTFPIEEVKGRDLYFIAGGIGLPPLRSVINSVLVRKGEFGKIGIIYGARSPVELCFKEELRSWQAIEGVEARLSVDLPDGDWRGKIGVVTELWGESENWTGGVAYVCGPPVMIKFVVEKLLRTGLEEDDIYITLERHMKCGIGKCGHCNIGGKFVCLDGPVFSLREINKFPEKEKVI